MEERSRMLLDKYHNGTATAEELDLLEKWFLQYRAEDQSEQSDLELEQSHNRSWKYLMQHTQPRPVQKLWKRITVAASLLLIAGTCLFYFSKENNKTKQDGNYANDISPGKVGATLTLANGQKISLTNAANGEIAKEAGISVTKTSNGQVIYSRSSEEEKSKGQRGGRNNTLTTAKGETYILTLPDKSKVWLNAASSLTYSTTLNERGVRRVRLEGEAYFEIFKDKDHPFVVESRGQQVQVLGTHFNINSYTDEPNIKTTLLEGSVKVSSNTRTKILKPGEQSALAGNALLNVKAVNVQDAVDWKSGDFVFNGENLESLMRKVSRWYDIDVEYKTAIPPDELIGKVSRSKNISQVLKALEAMKIVHFKIEGRKVIVTR